jgi:anaerobic nitric oxide reductase transcription regulator
LVAQDLVRDVLARRGGFLLGNSAAMNSLRREVELVASSNFPVLVTGETGVGKELVVRTLHSQSPRAEQPLVYVNCAALPESVVESELFGHTRGAFTGAEQARPGKFRVADGATLFLDEIGELPLSMQPKFLRALQEGEIQPVGSDHTVHVDVRLLAATNRDLEAEVRAGRFRADLLHRLDVCRIRVPPLREHRQDIPQLCGHFGDRIRRRLGTGAIRFQPAAMAALSAGAWPGNVRELENVLASASLAASEVIGAEHLPAHLREHEALAPSSGAGIKEAVRAFRRRFVEQAMSEAGADHKQAAAALGVHPKYLFKLLRELRDEA